MKKRETSLKGTILYTYDYKSDKGTITDGSEWWFETGDELSVPRLIIN